jgi:hypothetical protein
MEQSNNSITSRTDWAKIDAIIDEDIDTSDISPLTDKFFSKAKLRMPSLLCAISTTGSINPINPQKPLNSLE